MVVDISDKVYICPLLLSIVIHEFGKGAAAIGDAHVSSGISLVVVSCLISRGNAI